MCIRDSFGGVAQCRDSQQRDGLDGKAGGECEHEAVGTHLNAFGAVLGDKGVARVHQTAVLQYVCLLYTSTDDDQHHGIEVCKA